MSLASSSLRSMKRSPACPLLTRCLLFFVFFGTRFLPSGATNYIDGSGLLRYGETIVSTGGRFELGFLGLGSFAKKFLCVRFIKDETKPIVWVANREHPLNTSSGALKFGSDGNLVVLDTASDIVIWSTGLPSNTSGNRVAQLLDSGNLVVRDANDDRPGEFLWQSFDEPGDTLLPGMKIVVNTKTNASRRLTSWKSTEDPSPGNFSFGLEINILPRLVLRQGSTMKYTTGMWNGIRFTGVQSMNNNPMFNSSVVSSGDETYYTDSMIGNSMLLRVVLLPSGDIQRLVWKEETNTWTGLWTAPMKCERFAACGPYGTCVEDVFPSCQCLKGFIPKSPTDWSMGNGVDGCVRSSKLACSDLFLPVLGAKLPEMSNSSVDMDMSLGECRRKCAKDCSCIAYASADVKAERRGCWSGDLVDVRNISNNVQEFYLRVTASDMVEATTDVQRKRSKKIALPLIIGVPSGVLLLLLLGFWMKKMIVNTKTGITKHPSHNIMVDGEDIDIPLFDFKKIASVTNNFSADNRIGQGGFGAVYKAVLEGGQEVAVKRLTWNSAQGVKQFMKEVKLIVIQHKNLVRLHGCCIHGDERLLIFEYMQNGSLDSFIFDKEKRSLLDWRMRLAIILGTARGLLYLHHGSRFKIVHRDLKPGNVLLDGAMNPKISDFSFAKIFSDADQQTKKTTRIVGTFGYAAPEYLMNGIISIKSDVFSFGVLVLEVLSGIKIQRTYETEPYLNLLGYAWKLWQAGNCLELLDPMVASPFHEVKLMRCIQVGLLCVQENAIDRPTMRQVVKMLDTENVPLPEPGRLGFGADTRAVDRR